MTGSTIASTSAAITAPPISIAPPEPKPFRPGPRSPAWPLGHSRQCPRPSCALSRPEPIKLTVPIRHWKDLHFFRPDRAVRYQHIDALFTATIDWELIEAHLPDMLRVALSVKAGRLLPSAILRRLATHSRKNRLYFAFRELGRVIRTIFLLRYLSSIELRRVIQAATNKSEHF